MKCPECIDLGLKSRVYPGIGATTLMGWQTYYDEDGMYHKHDPNKTTTSYRCSEGHTWQRESLTPCPNCLYGRRGMTRNSRGEVVPQCEAKYLRDFNHFRCIKEEGHDGEHTDNRGTWNTATEEASTDEVPAVPGG